MFGGVLHVILSGIDIPENREMIKNYHWGGEALEAENKGKAGKNETIRITI